MCVCVCVCVRNSSGNAALILPGLISAILVSSYSGMVVDKRILDQRSNKNMRWNLIRVSQEYDDNSLCIRINICGAKFSSNSSQGPMCWGTNPHTAGPPRCAISYPTCGESRGRDEIGSSSKRGTLFLYLVARQCRIKQLSFSTMAGVCACSLIWQYPLIMEHKF